LPRKWIIFSIGALGALLLVGIVALSHFAATHEPPRTIGVRIDAQGVVQQRIVCEASYTNSLPMPGPEGFTSKRRYSLRYFLEAPGKPRRELTFLRDAPISMCDLNPVPNNTMWAAAGFLEDEGRQFAVLVFDETQVRVHRRLNVTPDWGDPGHDFRFGNGNSTLFFRSTRGFDAYDIATDTVSAAPASAR
jgi:hypothetical protein